MTITESVCTLLRTSLQLDGMVLGPDTPLLGALPQLDSLAVLNLLLAIEQQFGLRIADDEVRAAHFATVGTLAAFVQEQLG